jgi:hypothetical protein
MLWLIQSIDSHWLGDVLDLLKAKISESEGQHPSHILLG